MKGVSIKARKKLLLILSTIALSYFIALLLFGIKSIWTFQSTKNLYSNFKVNGYSKEWKSEYLSILPLIDDCINDGAGLLLAPIRTALANQQDFSNLLKTYEMVGPALPILPELLGLDETKKYLIAFQNSAEARGTGGILGAYAVAELNGSLQIREVGTNAGLESQDQLPVRLPPEFRSIYRNDPAIWQNSNMSPHFPYGSRIWLALWDRQFKEKLDGVVTVDPIVLKSILEITGPIQVRNKTISAANVVAETLSSSYLDYQSDNLARKQYLVEIIEGTASAIRDYNFQWNGELIKLSKPLIENRVLIYSSLPKIQRILSNAQISGTLSKKYDNQFRLVVQNTAGNKMDYYLKRKLKISSKSCEKRRITQAEFSLINTASKDFYLPAYVKGRLDLDLPGGKNNSTSLSVFLYGPYKSKLVSAIDPTTGTSIGYQKSERGRPALVIPLELEAGEMRKFIVDFEGGVGNITTHIQPLVIKQSTQIVDQCR